MGVQKFFRGFFVDPAFEAKMHVLADKATEAVSEMQKTTEEARGLVSDGRRVLKRANMGTIIVGTGVVVLLAGVVTGVAVARSERQRQK